MSGHIRRRGEWSWELKFDIGCDPFTGRRKTGYHSFKGTKREAPAELTRLLAQAGEGTSVDPAKATVAELLDTWLDIWATGNTSAKTCERCRGLMNNQVKPHIGALPIQKLRPVHLAELYATLLEKGGAVDEDEAPRPLAARTVGHVHRVLHRALGHAVKWNIITSNVADDVEPPGVETTEVAVLSPPQVAALLDHFAGKALYPPVVTALATGIRRGELLAVRWSDLDLDSGKLGSSVRSSRCARTGSASSSRRLNMAGGPFRWRGRPLPNCGAISRHNEISASHSD